MDAMRLQVGSRSVMAKDGREEGRSRLSGVNESPWESGQRYLPSKFGHVACYESYAATALQCSVSTTMPPDATQKPSKLRSERDLEPTNLAEKMIALKRRNAECVFLIPLAGLP